MTPGAQRPGGRRLVLLRHAKAERPGGGADALRPLALQGRRQCVEVGVSLSAAGLVPERVLVSSAVRTRQTWELVRASLGDVPAPEVEISDLVYEARAFDIIDLVQAVDDRVATLLVVGHEPTMSHVASDLAAADGDDAHVEAARSLRSGLPTASYAVLEVGSWAEASPGTARVLSVVRPAR